MSDGALSQDEIDALLAGVDSAGIGGGAMPGPATATMSPMNAMPAMGGMSSMGTASDGDRKILSDFLASTVDAQASNLSMMTGSSVSIRGPQAVFINQDNFLPQLPEQVTIVKADFSAGFPGDHIYLMSDATAKSIAGLINKEDNIELDEMAMSVIGEVVSQLIGTQITDLTKKTNNKSIAANPPEARNIKKAAAALPRI